MDEYKKQIISNKMIAANANTTFNCVAYSNHFNFLAYASANLIHVYDIKSKKTYLTLKGHKSRVNSINIIENSYTKVVSIILFIAR